MQCIVRAVDTWQTLIGALTALAAAIWAGHIIRSQVLQADRIEKDRRLRRATAARATLPLVLSGMSNHALAVAEKLRIFHQLLSQRGAERQGLLLDRPPPPSDLIPALERMIEASESAQLVTLLRKMLSELQLLQSRTEELNRVGNDAADMPHNIETYILQCAVIYAQSANAFDYARFKSEEVLESASWAGIYNAFAIMRIRDFEFPGIYQFCNQLQEQGVSPES